MKFLKITANFTVDYGLGPANFVLYHFGTEKPTEVARGGARVRSVPFQTATTGILGPPQFKQIEKQTGNRRYSDRYTLRTLQRIKLC